MPDESDPPRRYYELKPREFERANPVPPGALPPGFHPAQPQGHAPEAARIDVRELNRQAAGSGNILNPGRVTPPDAEVQAVLRENQAREAAAGLFRVEPSPRRVSRRKKDYILVVTVSNAFFGALAVGAWQTRNAVLFVFSAAAMGIITAATTWIMFHIMDDY